MDFSKFFLCLFTLVSFYNHNAFAAGNEDINVAEDVDSLGGNAELMKKAQILKSQSRTRIVQDRIVNRHQKFEFGLSYGSVVGGDTYLNTYALGLNVDYHLTPRWSVGAHYIDFTNKLSAEGQRVFDQYRQARNAGTTPAYSVDVDYPTSAVLAVVNWYPIYGKTSFLDMGITQFDIYLIGSAGQMQLSSGSTSVYNTGLGVGAWLTKHLALRAEAKYQAYSDKPVTGARHLDTVTANMGIGWIL